MGTFALWVVGGSRRLFSALQARFQSSCCTQMGRGEIDGAPTYLLTAILLYQRLCSLAYIVPIARVRVFFLQAFNGFFSKRAGVQRKFELEEIWGGIRSWHSEYLHETLIHVCAWM